MADAIVRQEDATNPSDVEDLNQPPELAPEPELTPEGEPPAPEEEAKAPEPEPAKEPAPEPKPDAPPPPAEDASSKTVDRGRFDRYFARAHDLAAENARLKQELGARGGGEDAPRQPSRQEMYEQFRQKFAMNPDEATFEYVNQMVSNVLAAQRDEQVARERAAGREEVEEILFRQTPEAVTDEKYRERITNLWTIHAKKLMQMDHREGSKWLIDEYRRHWGTPPSEAKTPPAEKPAGAVPKGAALGMGGGAGGNGAKNIIFQEDVEAMDLSKLIEEEGEEAAEAYLARVDKARDEGRYYSKRTGKPV